MSQSRPEPSVCEERLGIMDWGIGGLGFFKLLRQARPHQHCVYFSDSGAPPYGTLAPDALRQRVEQVLAWFAERQVIRVVVACNAASSVLGLVQSEVERIGVIAPTLERLLTRPACSIGIFGGRRTVRSGVYRRPLLEAGFAVQQRVAQPLSALVEAGQLSGGHVEAEVRRIVGPLVGNDVLVPACTHYVALLPLFRALAPRARFLDPAELALDLVLKRWASSTPKRKKHSQPDSAQPDTFATTGSVSAFRRGAARAFGLSLGHVEKVRALQHF
jgi:glutamate racemase